MKGTDTLFAVALLAIVLAACSGPTPGQAYSAAADALNAVYAAEPAPAATLDEWHAWGGRVVTANQAFVKTLQGMSGLDARTADDVHALIAEIAAEQTAASQIAAATSLDQVSLVVRTWPVSNAANLVRLDLGLPPVPITSPAASPS